MGLQSLGFYGLALDVQDFRIQRLTVIWEFWASGSGLNILQEDLSKWSPVPFWRGLWVFHRVWNGMPVGLRIIRVVGEAHIRGRVQGETRGRVQGETRLLLKRDSLNPK